MTSLVEVACLILIAISGAIIIFISYAAIMYFTQIDEIRHRFMEECLATGKYSKFDCKVLYGYGHTAEQKTIQIKEEGQHDQE